MWARCGPDASSCGGAGLYLHVMVPSDPSQLIHGHDVEALAEDGPLHLNGTAVSGQAEGTLARAARGRDTGETLQEGSS